MKTIQIQDYSVQELTQNEIIEVQGGSWGLVARVGLRVVVGAAGVASGAALVIGAGLLAWEIYEALQ
jgi:hypothetical protein